MVYFFELRHVLSLLNITSFFKIEINKANQKSNNEAANYRNNAPFNNASYNVI